MSEHFYLIPVHPGQGAVRLTPAGSLILREIEEMPEGRNRDIAALKLSIEKWEYIAAYVKTGIEKPLDGGTNSCALCALYFGRECAGCPVREKTGKKVCGGSPYQDYEQALVNEAQLQATREVAFLKGLLAEECEKALQDAASGADDRPEMYIATVNLFFRAWGYAEAYDSISELLEENDLVDDWHFAVDENGRTAYPEKRIEDEL